MTPHINEILLRFRSHQVGIIADNEKVFHQIAIDERDREFLRFLGLTILLIMYLQLLSIDLPDWCLE